VGDDLPVLYRMSGDDFVAEGGLTVADTVPFAAQLERAGVDLIDVSAGTYESITATQPPMEAAPGTLVELAAAIKAAVSIPVATAGKLAHLDVAEQALADGRIDFVTIGRGLHADPELLAKTRAGRAGEVRRCIACAECVAFLGQDLPAYCAVNPATIRERELAEPPVSAAPRRVVVAGAGPAGLEAARSAALRGHEVSVYERAPVAGGQVRFGSLVEGRAPFAEPVRLLQRELDRLGVPVHLGRGLDAALVRELDPDVLVVATGARPAPRPVPGADRPHVVEALDVLADPDAAGEPTSVVVAGGSWTGCHVTDLLLARGHAVTIVEPRPALAYDMGDQQGMVLRERVREHPRCTLLLETTLQDIADADVGVWDARGDRHHRVDATLVVLVSRLEADRDLADELAGDGRTEVHLIGDAAGPRRLADAVLEGARLAAVL
jgi:thioredoxin reductase